MKILLTLILIVAIKISSFSQVFEKEGAGVTIIIHGWNPEGNEPLWMNGMANAVISRSGGDGQIGVITVSGSAGNLTATCSDWNFDLGTATSGEIVVLVNWTAVANNLTTFVTAQSVAAVVTPKIYETQNGQPALSELPIHLIGHSRGGGMTYEIARLLGLQGIEVEHLTSLDPHPLTETDPQPVIGTHTIDTPVVIYENILFADNYYQNIEFPTGEYVDGTYNRLWTSMTGGYHNEIGYTYNLLWVDYNFSDHLNIILMYHGTINLTTPENNGEATITQVERDNWFNTYETQGEIEGFYYSRNILGNRKSTDIPVASGDAIIDGYHNNVLLGGNGVRTNLSWSSAAWPNILTLNLVRDSNNLAAGLQVLTLSENLDINFIYRSYANSTDATFYVDIDRNPYNSNSTSIQTQNNIATGSIIAQSSVNWIVSGLSIGTKYYIYAEINDGTNKRYIYAPYELYVANPVSVNPIENSHISIYPNPTVGILNFEFSNNNLKKLIISDITGKHIIEKSVSKQNEAIDLSNFENGIYILSIQADNKKFTTKIIKI